MNNPSSTKIPGSILVVDDTPANLYVLVELLEQQDFTVAVAQDGEEAIRRACHIQPDLILLDVMMPGLDGFATCRRLKELDATRDIPVIFMTALSGQDDKLRGFAAGGVDYVTKPLEVAEVLARINTHLALRKAEQELQAKNQRLLELVRLHQESELALSRACHDLSESEDRYRKLMDLLPEAVLVHGANEIVYANAGARQLFALRSLGDLIGSSILTRVAEPFRDAVTQCLQAAGSGLPQQEGTRQLQMLRGDGTTTQLEVRCVSIHYSHMPALMLILRDAGEQPRCDTLQEQQAAHDPLTGLPNRQQLYRRLTQAIRQAERDSSLLGLMFIGLDRFKYFNDSYGHEAGDELLCAIAQRLKQCMRDCDMVARLGGDEFVLLVERLASEEMLPILAQRVLGMLAEPIKLQEQMHMITCSMGVCRYPHDGSSADELLKRADIAMYQAKENGRNNFQLFTPRMEAQLEALLGLEEQLRHALDRNEFELYYQPQVSLRSGRIVGCEALIRWRSPMFGVLLPRQFLPQAEACNLMPAIGKWVLQSACAQAKAWQQAGLAVLPVAVNVSTSQLADAGFDQLVRRTLEACQLDPGHLVLEFSENLPQQESDSAIALLLRLKQLGVSLTLDDFGSDYSSLGALQRFPLDRLKIDQAFVQGMANEPRDLAIVQAILRLAQSLDVQVVAKGVESASQVTQLSEQGCEEIQGHYFCAALPPDELKQFLLSQPQLELPSLQPSHHS
jgi:diguanylate cyclase (GGDEF)-like protein/PAS domain S-box-containing protein